MRLSWLVGLVGLVVLLGAAGAVAQEAAAPENSVLGELLQKGVTMSDGTAVKLPAPTLRDGLDAARQQAVLAPLGGANHPLADLTRSSLVAPFVLNIRTVETTNPKAPARLIDLWFFAQGDWKTLNSNDFLEGLFKAGERSASANRRLSQSGGLTPEELAKRSIPAPRVGPAYEERYFYGMANFFDRVEVRSTRFSVFNRHRESLVLAAKIDPRFTSDRDHPNQWRSLVRQEDGSLLPGPPHPYTESSFYVKATQLIEPAGTIFIEYHMVFEEPFGWFEGANLLASKLPLLAQDEVRNFRRKLMNASKPRPAN